MSIVIPDSPSLDTAEPAEPVFYTSLGQIVQAARVQTWTGTNVIGQPTTINYPTANSTGVPAGYTPQFAATVTAYPPDEWQLIPTGPNAINPWSYIQPQNTTPSMTGPNFIGFVGAPMYEDFSSTAMTDVDPQEEDELSTASVKLEVIPESEAKERIMSYVNSHVGCRTGDIIYDLELDPDLVIKCLRELESNKQVTGKDIVTE